MDYSNNNQEKRLKLLPKSTNVENVQILSKPTIQNFPFLPNVILVLIFEQIPDTLLIIKRICKQWNNIVNNSYRCWQYYKKIEILDNIDKYYIFKFIKHIGINQSFYLNSFNLDSSKVSSDLLKINTIFSRLTSLHLDNLNDNTISKLNEQNYSIWVLFLNQLNPKIQGLSLSTLFYSSQEHNIKQDAFCNITSLTLIDFLLDELDIPTFKQYFINVKILFLFDFKLQSDFQLENFFPSMKNLIIVKRDDYYSYPYHLEIPNNLEEITLYGGYNLCGFTLPSMKNGIVKFIFNTPEIDFPQITSCLKPKKTILEFDYFTSSTWNILLEKLLNINPEIELSILEIYIKDNVDPMPLEFKNTLLNHFPTLKECIQFKGTG